MEWCAVWKGSVKDCLDHLCSKHDGAQLMAMKTLGKFVPPWTVSREFWQAALRPDMSGVETDVRLFHESGCRFVHRYRIYKDPMPHVSLQGKVVANLIMFVHRATTHLHLAIRDDHRTGTIGVLPGCSALSPACLACQGLVC